MVQQNKKIKVCHIAAADLAVRFLLLPQLEFLVREGFDVCAVCSPGPWIKEIESRGIKVKTIRIKRKISPFYDLISLARLFFYFKKEKFDIVHTHTPKPGLLGQLAAKAAGVPVIINTIHGFYFNENTPLLKKKFYIFIEKLAATCSTLIFSQNREDIKTAISQGICREQKIKYLGNGVNIDFFSQSRFPNGFIEAKKKEMKISGNAKIIGIVGRLVAEKGYPELFEAFKKVLTIFPNAILIIVGQQEPQKKDKIDISVLNHYGIARNTIFLGERRDVDEIYALMDIFVLPSHREGFPRSIIEAAAMSKPVVATDIRGCREAVENQKTGILVPVGDPGKLSQALIYLLENRDKAKEFSENARKMAETQFDERLIFAKIKECYKALMH